MAQSFTDSLRENRMIVVAVDRQSGRVRVKGASEACTDLTCSGETLVVSDEGEASGRTRQAVLLLRKHLEGRHVAVVRRVRGERTVVIEAGSVALVFRLSGAPAATLVVDGAPVSTFGEGREAWPLPEPDAQREASWSTPDERRPSVRIGGPLVSRHDADLAAPGAVAVFGLLRR
jgi:hypothetical protein